MLTQDTTNQLYTIFLQADDFCLALQEWKQRTGRFQLKSYWQKPQLSDSEVITILIFYHYSGYKCFQYYYERMVQRELKSYFPGVVSYERFLISILRILPGIYVFLQVLISNSSRTGFYFIDSKKLAVCHNKRIHSHRVFEGVAERGKTSVDWFYGLKVHLLINNMGQIVRFAITPGNIVDNNTELLKDILFDLKGECYGDKGYISSLFEQFYERGLQIVTKLRSNMKNTLMKLDQKLKLKKRALIESVFDIMNSVLEIEHTRHRKPANALAHILSCLCAYCFYPSKPSIFVQQKMGLIIA